MKRRHFLNAIAQAGGVVAIGSGFQEDNPMAAVAPDAALAPHLRLVGTEGLTYFQNSFTHAMAFYLSYELAPGHTYQIEVTSDAIHWIQAGTITVPTDQSTDFYFTYSVSQCEGPWPRIIDITPV